MNNEKKYNGSDILYHLVYLVNIRTCIDLVCFLATAKSYGKLNAVMDGVYTKEDIDIMFEKYQIAQGPIDRFFNKYIFRIDLDKVKEKLYKDLDA